MKRAEQIAVGLHARVLCLAHYGRPMHGVEWRESGVDGYGPSFVAVWRSSACVLLIQTICCVSRVASRASAAASGRGRDENESICSKKYIKT